MRPTPTSRPAAVTASMARANLITGLPFIRYSHRFMGVSKALAVCLVGVTIAGCARSPESPRAVPAAPHLEQQRDSEADPYDARFLSRLDEAGFQVADPGAAAFNARSAVCVNLRNGYSRQRIEADLKAVQHGWTADQIALFVDVAMSTYPDCAG